jgi:hypothetical protein
MLAAMLKQMCASNFIRKTIIIIIIIIIIINVVT